ncbi:MAG: type I-E CRISPR-associated protein Cse1/CasA [Leptospiraceae bacterium]|nr:type I-E CRISPR-associated protein Cse1/CasA [Leptospiraceae bacterium]
MVAKKKDSKTSTKMEKVEAEHNFSFNLLDNPWLPVVTLKGEKEFLSVNEFLNKAHELERFDFPLPGLETAVIRFFVALVHIIGAPETLKDWENSLLAGKFDKKFSKDLNEQYYDKFDLFSKTDPFMQEKKIDEKFIKPLSKLIDEFPSGNNSVHFGTKELKANITKNDIGVDPAIAAALLLYCQMTPRSGLGGFLSGVINAKTPYYILLKGKNLFESITLNVLHNQALQSIADNSTIGIPKDGWYKIFKGDVLPNKIRIQDGLLWSSRIIKLIPHEVAGLECSISARKSSILIRKIFYSPQQAQVKARWEDPFNGLNQIKNEVKKISPNGKNLPAWKDYPAFIFSERNEEKKSSILRPKILERALNSKQIQKFSIKLFVFGVSTKQDKVFQTSEYTFPFNPDFIESEDIKTVIKYFVFETSQFESALKTALIKSLIKKSDNLNGDRKRKAISNITNLFQSAYWHEIGSNFEESLNRLSDEEDSNLILIEWREMLAEHVRKTFRNHTEKLIANPKNLKQYENGRKYLERMIYAKLLFHKKNKENK